MAYIAVDIGHGSNTFPPSKGIVKGGKSYPEHSFNAKLGIAVKNLLEKNGHRVILGQQPNKADVNLNTRTNLYNREKVDLVISIHANYNDSTATNGRCAFYWGTSSKSKALATSVIKAIKAKGYSTHGNGLHAGERGSWTNLHINRQTNMPSVLVEHGFMSGSQDFDLVFGSKQNQYIKDMAEADVKGIQDWLGKSFKGGAVVPEQAIKPNTSKTIETLAKETIQGAYGYGQDRKDRLGKNYDPVQKRVNELMGVTKNPTKPITPNKPFKPSKPKPKANLKIDGYLGKLTIKELQKALGTYVDGIISKPSNVVKALQKLLGARIDGILGKETYTMLQRYLGTPVDGKLSKPSLMIKELQRRLNAGTLKKR